VVKVNEEVEIIGLKPTVKTICTGWRCSGSSWMRAGGGQRGSAAARHEERGCGARAGAGEARSITPHTNFECEVYVLTKEEGGRHTPFFKGYRPQFYFRTTDVTGMIQLPEGTEMVMPGDNIKMTVELISPIAMEEGLRFAIREAVKPSAQASCRNPEIRHCYGQPEYPHPPESLRSSSDRLFRARNRRNCQAHGCNRAWSRAASDQDGALHAPRLAAWR